MSFGAEDMKRKNTALLGAVQLTGTVEERSSEVTCGILFIISGTVLGNHVQWASRSRGFVTHPDSIGLTDSMLRSHARIRGGCPAAQGATASSCFAELVTSSTLSRGRQPLEASPQNRVSGQAAALGMVLILFITPALARLRV